MNALRQLAGTLATFGTVNCAPTPTVVAEPAKPRVTRPAASSNPSIDSTHNMAEVKLAVVYWPWLGQRIAVRIRDVGGSYRLTAEMLLTADKDMQRSWTRQVPKTVEFEHLLSTLNPLELAEHDPCGRSWRDGTSWLVMNVVAGTKTMRARDANGTLALEECKSFDDACRQLMQLVGITCPTGKACLLAEDRVPGDAGTP